MKYPPFVKLVLGTLRECGAHPQVRVLRAMTRAEYDALPAAVRAFIPWSEASRPMRYRRKDPRKISDEEGEKLLAYFEGTEAAPVEQLELFAPGTANP